MPVRKGIPRSFRKGFGRIPSATSSEKFPRIRGAPRPFRGTPSAIGWTECLRRDNPRDGCQPYGAALCSRPNGTVSLALVFHPSAGVSVMSSELVLHRGGREVSREELDAVPCPPPVGKWRPVPHGQV